MDIAEKKGAQIPLESSAIQFCVVSERNCLDFGLRVVDYYMQIQGTALERPVCSLRVIQSGNMLEDGRPVLNILDNVQSCNSCNSSFHRVSRSSHKSTWFTFVFFVMEKEIDS